MAKVRRFFWNLNHHQQVIKANPIFILEQIDKMDIYAYF